MFHYLKNKINRNNKLTLKLYYLYFKFQIHFNFDFLKLFKSEGKIEQIVSVYAHIFVESAENIKIKVQRDSSISHPCPQPVFYHLHSCLYRQEHEILGSKQ